jgi:hypothetical protein
MMTRHSDYAADLSAMPGSQFDEFAGNVQISLGGDVPSVSIESANKANTPADSADHLVGVADLFARENLVISGDSSEHSVSADPTATFGDDHLNLASSAVDTSNLPNGQSSIQEGYPGLDNSLKNDHLASVFDHNGNLNFNQVESFSHWFNDSPLGGASSGVTADPSFELPGVNSPGVPDVASEANGHGGGGSGGGGGGGGTTPAPYTTNSGTGVDIHVTFDSSVGSAPAAFVSTVEKVADFFANLFEDSTPITINIAVGYGEVDGMRMGIGAVGESVTNLQQVSYSQLASAYSGTGLSLGNSVPSGNLYVSYAEAKALNIPITDPQTVDGYVGFSSRSSFDYNNADGVSSRQYDFYGVVAHEFSEVMGRILLVGATISNTASYMAYDLFHFSSPGMQDFSGNGGYFSTDQGTTNLANFNNPSNGGDAGDWASTGTSNSGGSAYDAFNAFDTTGHVEPVTHTDLLALQALGYQLHTLV